MLYFFLPLKLNGLPPPLKLNDLLPPSLEMEWFTPPFPLFTPPSPEIEVLSARMVVGINMILLRTF